MAEIGPLLEANEIVAFEDGTWMLAVGEDVAVMAEYDEGENRLVLSTEVGPLDGPRREAELETLMVYNNNWRQSGGVRLALDDVGGTVIQLLDLAVADLDAGKLARVLSNFLAVRSGWLDFLAAARKRTAAKDGEAGSAAEEERGLIRV